MSTPAVTHEKEIGEESEEKGGAEDPDEDEHKGHHKKHKAVSKEHIPMVVTANPAFEEKMSKLTAMIEEQSKNITRLEETASALREEKLKTEEVTRQSIAELRQDLEDINEDMLAQGDELQARIDELEAKLGERKDD